MASKSHIASQYFDQKAIGMHIDMYIIIFSKKKKTHDPFSGRIVVG